jgi:hypothetical protein
VIVPDKDGVGVTETVGVIVPDGVTVSLGVIVELGLTVDVTDAVLVDVGVVLMLGVPVGLDVALVVALNDSTDDDDSVCDIVADPVLVLVSNAVLVAVTVLNVLLVVVAEADCDPEDVCEELDVRDNTDEDEICGDILSDIMLDTDADLSDVGLVSKLTEATTELVCIGDSDGFAPRELDGSNDSVPGIEAVEAGVTSADADTDGDTNSVRVPSVDADTDGDTNGVSVPSAEYEANILDDTVVLSVDDVESLICGVFVTVCIGDGDAVEGSVWERVACSEDDGL